MSRAREKSRLASIVAFPVEASGVGTIDEYKAWTRRKIRPVFPHKILISGYGHLHAGGVAIDYLVTVDFPPGYLQQLRNRAGAIDTPILRRWIATREPQLFEIDRPWPDVPAAWLEVFRRSGLINTASHGGGDPPGCVATYTTLHPIPGRLGEAPLQ